MLRTTIAFLLLLSPADLTGTAIAGDRISDTAARERAETCHCRCEVRGKWVVAETASFSIWTHGTQPAAVDIARTCERLRTELSRDWKLTSDVPWTPKCAIVLHPTLHDYRQELGLQDQSVGCTTTTCDDGRIVFRRIDLRADADDWRSNALPHEMTHVILAERFANVTLPQWLSEGLAMLAETDDLRHRREAVLTSAHQRGALPSLSTILAAGPNLPHRDANVSYAVSAGLVRQLEQQLGRESLLDFAERLAADSRGVPSTETLALVEGITTWERRWLDSIGKVEPAPLASR